jgi:hypothetical protein
MALRSRAPIIAPDHVLRVVMVIDVLDVRASIVMGILWVCNKTVLFLSFPYVCPEPVLVK